jgi:hypothetical protein
MSTKQSLNGNLNINKFNSLINQASNAIMCDSNCQKQKQAEALKQKFQAAQANLATATGQVQVAEQNYVTLTQGSAAYSELQDQQLTAKAEEISNQILELVSAAAADITTDIASYNGLLLNFKNVVELYKKYKIENAKLEKDLKITIDDVSKNDRKTYYENQEIDNLKYYYTYFFMFIYSICVICFIIFGFKYPSQITVVKRLFIFIGLLILPFISTWLLGMLIKFIYYLYSLLPTNVYKERKY